MNWCGYQSMNFVSSYHLHFTFRNFSYRLPLACQFVHSRYGAVVASHLLCEPIRWDPPKSIANHVVVSSVNWLQTSIDQRPWGIRGCHPRWHLGCGARKVENVGFYPARFAFFLLIEALGDSPTAGMILCPAIEPAPMGPTCSSLTEFRLWMVRWKDGTAIVLLPCSGKGALRFFLCSSYRFFPRC